MASPSAFSTPINTLTREALTVLIKNNIMNNSVEFSSDCESMKTDSPVRNPNMHLVGKKLCYSPMNNSSTQKSTFIRRCDMNQKAKKRTLNLFPDSGAKIKRAYVTECNRDEYTENNNEGMRKRILVSLFHNKEYAMDCEFGD